jgi:two-component system chemotaxis sensor kinase CheA
MDITRFHAAFFEESREGLDAMEGGLLAMESGRSDAETINVIFRAAHSIKGGAATFGFTAVTDLTHLLETLLDEARGGRRVLDAEATGVLLVSVDVLRGLLAGCEHGDPIDQGTLAQARSRLEQLLAAETKAASPQVKPADTVTTSGDWRISFTPAPSLFMSGNDPLRILRELASHGELGVTCLDERLPRFEQLDPYEAYLAWDLTLPGDVPRSAIDEAFAWVEDECALTVETMPKRPPQPTAAPAIRTIPSAWP